MAIPLLEETVERAGAINAVLHGKPRLPGQSMPLRGKSLMKRRAELAGIRVGIFEEANDRDDVVPFLKRVNQAPRKLDGDRDDPIHFKAFDKAGCMGHRVIRAVEDAESITESEFAALIESHLDGWEFAAEARVWSGEARFLNISGYAHLGWPVHAPAAPELEKHRPQVEQEVEELVKAFDVQSGVIHTGSVLTNGGQMHFGEVASRPPGVKVFELLERVHTGPRRRGRAYPLDGAPRPGRGPRPRRRARRKPPRRSPRLNPAPLTGHLNTMKIVRLKDLIGTDRDVAGPNWVSRRFLLKKDGMGFSFHETIIPAGAELPMWYKNHLEAVYCVAGNGSIEDLETGEVHPIEDGTLYALDEHDRHVLRGGTEDMRLVCAFNPPVTGRETHDEDGAYRLVEDDG